MFEYRGNLHVHSSQSDGSLAVENIAELADKLNLDFVGLNDHHVFYDCDKYFGRVLVLMGTEFNDTHNHYLAYGAPLPLDGKQLAAKEVVDHVATQGGLGIIAHPFEKGSPLVSGGRHYPWRNWDIEAVAVEIWNCTSQWRDAIKGWTQALGMYLFNRNQPFASGPCPLALERWDQLCRKRHVTAVAGSDLHGPRLGRGLFSIEVLGYKMLLKLVNNYVLTEKQMTGEAQADAELLLNALRRGRVYIAADYLAPGSGFRFWATNSKRIVTMGDKLNSAGAELQVQSPAPARLDLLRNGERILSCRGTELNYCALGPGVYRVEAFIGHSERPWVYTNPIYLD
ncbi:MAG: hypothetical protein FH749_06090 [Firmicutes bacterium]|nr:hypothetical protein [Bacillota bacterium]